MSEPDWLVWARELQAIAQTGLTFSEIQYDIDRYRAIERVAAAMMAAGSDTEFARIAELFAGQTGYATPKVDVRGAVIRGDEILLIREASDGRWALPGGWADVNQSPAECVVREVLEESGFEVRATTLAAVWDRSRRGHHPPFPFHVYKLFFLCELVGGVARPSHETTAVAFFRPDALPDLSTGRTLASQIHRMFDHHRDPALPTDFE
jgi:ADP-ribose pyrophosphatase YjhB (NUDIX family)